MEELIIRFGALEGSRNPTLNDIDSALTSIASGECQRGEFCLENVNNWRSETLYGKSVIRYRHTGPSMTAATFYKEGNADPMGWFVRYNAEIDQQFALSMGGEPDAELVEGICCGGPLKIRSSCVVSTSVALEALAYFSKRRARSPDNLWIASPSFSKLD